MSTKKVPIDRAQGLIRWVSVWLLGLSLMPSASFAGEAIPSLSDVYAGRFLFGFGGLNAPLVRKGLLDPQSPMSQIVEKQSNILSVNCFYPNQIHPSADTWQWRGCDSLMAFTEKHPSMPLRGHVLFWPSNKKFNLEWMLKDADGRTVSREEAILRLTQYIQTVMTRYPHRFAYWDVVNEAIEGNGRSVFKASLWRDVIGDDFVEIAFRAARAADPQAKLFYNDFQEWRPVKREAIFKLLQQLKAKGLVDGIGLQQHVSEFEPSARDLDLTLSRYAQLGLEIHITELDVELNNNAQFDSPTELMNQRLAKRYRELFDVYVKHAGSIRAVMTFNVTDPSSWLRHHPMDHETWPLLFDEQGQPPRLLFGRLPNR